MSYILGHYVLNCRHVVLKYRDAWIVEIRYLGEPGKDCVHFCGLRHCCGKVSEAAGESKVVNESDWQLITSLVYSDCAAH